MNNAEGLAVVSELLKNTENLDEVYKSLVHESYIKPIRTLVAVDDEFPTVDDLIELLEKNCTPSGNEFDFFSKFKDVDVQRVKDIIQYARNTERGWLVDIQDGSTIANNKNEKFSSHLQHSDLMILDYHLNGSEHDRGLEAIEVLRGLAKSSHFNMAAIYTKADSRSLREVFNDVAFSLTTKPVINEVSKDNIDLLEKFVEDNLPTYDGLDDFVGAAIERISIDLDLDLCSNDRGHVRILRKHADWKIILEWVGSISDENEIFERELGGIFAEYLINKLIEKRKDYFSETSYGQVKFGWSNDCNWIRVDTLFVTVIKKGDANPSQIPDFLLNALVQWRPGPHQILMAKLRALMDDEGVSAESGVLRDRFLQKGWLDQLFSDEHPKRLLNMRSNIEQHWGELGASLVGKINDFSNKLLNYLTKKGKDSSCEFFAMNSFKEDDVAIRLNIFNNSKRSVDNYALNTGHLLADLDENYWLCLTPACDLVPDRERGGRFKVLGTSVPVVMIKLHEVKQKYALENAETGSVIFLQINDQFKFFSFHFDGSLKSSPHWEQLYARGGGKFVENSIVLDRVCFHDNKMKINEFSLKLISQLRYEYAINLLIKLGNNLSRIGLDYVGARNQ
ncbi:response regulator receiver domain [Comamonas thiooxydans]|uniref:response regulator receiver domain n=1 Tax=Comamonas thiooxydans TaxID=363952 RepID=UPI00244CB7E4|nr:response regulator receiver domain [Comamonas thiooxydans]MDH1477007.1 response regulator receiver domain [Comamonas thiooxydans]